MSKMSNRNVVTKSKIMKGHYAVARVFMKVATVTAPTRLKGSERALNRGSPAWKSAF